MFLFGRLESENSKKRNSKKEKSKMAPSSVFQRQHVDLLLEELIKKFPPRRVKVKTVNKPIKKVANRQF